MTVQLGAPFSSKFLVQALLDHSGSARCLVALFEARFDPVNAECAQQASDDAALAFRDTLQSRTTSVT